MLLLGLLITHVLQHGVLGHESVLDRDLVRDRTAGWNTATHVFTDLAETPTIIGLTAAAAIGFRLLFGRWRESVYVVLAVAGETLIFLLTALVIERKRPPVPPLDVAPPTSSYPSGHTAAAVCFYGSVAAIALWRGRHALLRVAAVTLAIVLPLLVGASRLYRGMHFPSDVVAGLLLGLTWLSLTTRRVLIGTAGLRPAPRRSRPLRTEYGLRR
jgi:undecaprenyl-diphosphatase